MKNIFTVLFSMNALICFAMPSKAPVSPVSPPPITAPIDKVSSLYKDVQSGRGVPNAAFVDELFQIWLKLPDSAFEVNTKLDIYLVIAPKVGPWHGITQRRAAGFEAMVSLAGRESSWNWNEGRDQSAGNTSAETEESGAWQTSCNARVFDLRAAALLSGLSCKDYIVKAKGDHEFAADFTWYVLRGTTRHHGPVLRGEILPYMKKSRVDALEQIFKKAGK